MEDRVFTDIEQGIRALKRAALELKDMGSNIPAVECNLVRLLASIKMLEINISDPVNIIESIKGDRLAD